MQKLIRSFCPPDLITSVPFHLREQPALVLLQIQHDAIELAAERICQRFRMLKEPYEIDLRLSRRFGTPVFGNAKKILLIGDHSASFSRATETWPRPAVPAPAVQSRPARAVRPASRARKPGCNAHRRPSRRATSHRHHHQSACGRA